MTTSISSKAFCSITDRQTDKYLQNRCSFMRVICTKKIGAYLNQGPRKSRFPLNLTDIQIDIHTFRRTDICFYRVVLLLKRFKSSAKIALLSKYLSYKIDNLDFWQSIFSSFSIVLIQCFCINNQLKLSKPIISFIVYERGRMSGSLCLVNLGSILWVNFFSVGTGGEEGVNSF